MDNLESSVLSSVLPKEKSNDADVSTTDPTNSSIGTGDDDKPNEASEVSKTTDASSLTENLEPQSVREHAAWWALGGIVGYHHLHLGFDVHALLHAATGGFFLIGWLLDAAALGSDVADSHFCRRSRHPCVRKRSFLASHIRAIVGLSAAAWLSALWSELLPPGNVMWRLVLPLLPLSLAPSFASVFAVVYPLIHNIVRNALFHMLCVLWFVAADTVSPQVHYMRLFGRNRLLVAALCLPPGYFVFARAMWRPPKNEPMVSIGGSSATWSVFRHHVLLLLAVLGGVCEFFLWQPCESFEGTLPLLADVPVSFDFDDGLHDHYACAETFFHSSAKMQSYVESQLGEIATTIVSTLEQAGAIHEADSSDLMSNDFVRTVLQNANSTDSDNPLHDAEFWKKRKSDSAMCVFGVGSACSSSLLSSIDSIAFAFTHKGRELRLSLHLRDLVDEQFWEALVGESPRGAVSGTSRALAILDLSPRASASEIRRRYRTLAKLLHPDMVMARFATADDDTRVEVEEAANERFDLLQAAYEQLKQRWRR
ncbi:MAG: hypothetical protein MHM6MM_001370 [Cercozoa sp. M6MM]